MGVSVGACSTPERSECLAALPIASCVVTYIGYGAPARISLGLVVITRSRKSSSIQANSAE